MDKIQPKRNKKKIIIISIIGITILIIGYGILSKTKINIPEYSSVTVLIGDLIQSVEETGTITADLLINYGFEKSGQISKINVKVGDMVAPNMIIAELDNTKETQELIQARAELESRIAALDLQISGINDETKAESLASVERASASLTQAKAEREKILIDNTAKVQSAENLLRTAEENLRLSQGSDNFSKFTAESYQNARNTLSGTFVTLKNSLIDVDNILGIDNKQANDSFENNLGIINQETLIRAEQNYPVAKRSLQKAESSLQNISSNADTTNIDLALIVFSNSLTDISSLMSDVSRLLNATLPIGTLTQTELNTKKEAILSSATKISIASQNIDTASQNIDQAKNNVSLLSIAMDKAKQDLLNTENIARSSISLADASVAVSQASVNEVQASYERLIAPPRNVDLAGPRADVSRARAFLSSVENSMDKTLLHAKATGTISKISIEVGENVMGNSPVITSISETRNIKVDISESEIAKISVGDLAHITLDAFGDDKLFLGRVTQIDPAQTEISGVIHYRTTIIFDETILMMHSIRPGMTANVQIITDTRPQVVIIPERAIFTESSRSFVRVITPQKKTVYEIRQIETGIKGDDGKIEILRGLTKGEEIITFIRENE